MGNITISLALRKAKILLKPLTGHSSRWYHGHNPLFLHVWLPSYWDWSTWISVIWPLHPSPRTKLHTGEIMAISHCDTYRSSTCILLRWHFYCMLFLLPPSWTFIGTQSLCVNEVIKFGFPSALTAGTEKVVSFSTFISLRPPFRRWCEVTLKRHDTWAPTSLSL